VVDHTLFLLLQIADFGLTRLTDSANSTDNTLHVAGTFGYMPPEYDEFCFYFYNIGFGILKSKSHSFSLVSFHISNQLVITH